MPFGLDCGDWLVRKGDRMGWRSGQDKEQNRVGNPGFACSALLVYFLRRGDPRLCARITYFVPEVLKKRKGALDSQVRSTRKSDPCRARQ
jgi:hypothetical protein